jgi:hypothetical protein
MSGGHNQKLWVGETPEPGVASMISDSQRFKPISAPDSHRLTYLDGARGQLISVIEIEGYAVAAFPWGAISLPGELAERLRPLVGKKIGILCLDGYHIRDLEAEDHA